MKKSYEEIRGSIYLAPAVAALQKHIETMVDDIITGQVYEWDDLPCEDQDSLFEYIYQELLDRA